MTPIDELIEKALKRLEEASNTQENILRTLVREVLGTARKHVAEAVYTSMEEQADRDEPGDARWLDGIEYGELLASRVIDDLMPAEPKR